MKQSFPSIAPGLKLRPASLELPRIEAQNRKAIQGSQHSTFSQHFATVSRVKRGKFAKKLNIDQHPVIPPLCVSPVALPNPRHPEFRQGKTRCRI
jgi:hypothetical protein